MNNKNWEITDSNSVIYSGYSEEEMKDIFQDIVDGKIDLQWEGDLKLIEIHGIHH